MNDLHFGGRVARPTKVLHDAKLRISSASVEDVELSPKHETALPAARDGSMDGRLDA